jgi:HD-like signal output (HDOD) protein
MNAIEEATIGSRTAEREQILQSLKEIRDLPTLPSVFVRIIRVLRNPQASVKEISQVVEADQAITMKILKLINSSFYGLSRGVDSVHQAIVLLGATTLKNVVISASVFKALGGQGQSALFSRESFWQHSIGCGMIARYLGAKAGFARDEEGFIAGIIHDIGKVVLDQYFHDHFISIVKEAKSQGITFRQAELNQLGICHSEIGAFLAETWSLPEKLVEVIAGHHRYRPDVAEAPMVALIQLSDMLARKYKVGSGGDDLVPEVAPEVWQRLNLTEEQLAAWDEEIKAELAKGKEMLDLMMS